VNRESIPKVDLWIISLMIGAPILALDFFLATPGSTMGAPI